MQDNAAPLDQFATLAPSSSGGLPPGVFPSPQTKPEPAATVDLPQPAANQPGAAQPAVAQPAFDPAQTLPHDPSQRVGGTQSPSQTSDYGDAASLGASTSAGTRFRVLRPHARGGLGEVSVAKDQELNREVALKEIQIRHADNAASRLRFLLEAEITGGLEHPGIVPIYGLGQRPDGRPYYAMRFIDGEGLDAAIKTFHAASPKLTPGERTLQLRQLLSRFLDVCNAIAYAHSRGVLHRDLKPANIMLGKYGETLVVDWGLAKPMDQSPSDEASMTYLVPSSASGSIDTQMGAAVGTPQFMSPEQARGALGELGPASDVYSLGATLYVLLCGHPPFEERNVLKILELVKTGAVVSPARKALHVPKALDAICLKAMRLAAADRYPTAKALADDIEHWLADEAVSAYVEPWHERALRWARRHKAWTQAGAVTLLVVALVSVLASLLINEARRSELVAHQEADRQRTQAEQSFLQARHTVDDFFTRVSENKLLHVPGLQPLRRELLDEALAYYQSFLQQRGGDPAVRSELAATFYRVGLIKNETGLPREALASLRQALAEHSKLDRAQQQTAAARVLVADIHNAIGKVQQSLGELKSATAEFEQAMKLRQELVEQHPRDGAYARKLANSHNNLAVAAAQLGQSAKAREEYKLATAARRALTEQFPAVAQYRRDYAQGIYNQAVLAQQSGDLTPAAALLEQAAELYRQLVEQEPKVIEYHRELSATYRLLGDVQTDLGQTQAAWQTLQTGQAIAERLAKSNRFLTQLQADVAAFDVSLGRLKFASSAPDEAIVWFQKACDLLTQLVEGEPDVTRYQHDLAASLLHVGRVELAVRQLPEAEGHFAAGLAAYQQLAKENPADATLQEAIAQTHIDLGLVRRYEGHPAAAIESFEAALRINERLAQDSHTRLKAEARRADAWLNIAVENRTLKNREATLNALSEAIAVQHKLVQEHPEVVFYRQNLAEELYLQGVVHFEQQEYADALSAFEQVRPLREKLVTDDPANLDFQSALGTELDELGVVLWRLDRDQEALEAMRAATKPLRVAFERAGDVAQYRQNLASHFANLAKLERAAGDLALAAEAIVARQALFPDSAADLYEAAAELAATASVVGAEPGQLTDADKQERAGFVHQTLSTLEAAVAAGFARPETEQHAADVKRLRSDPRWRSLYGNPAYESIVKRLSQ